MRLAVIALAAAAAAVTGKEASAGRDVTSGETRLVGLSWRMEEDAVEVVVVGADDAAIEEVTEEAVEGRVAVAGPATGGEVKLPIVPVTVMLDTPGSEGGAAGRLAVVVEVGLAGISVAGRGAEGAELAAGVASAS